MLMARIERGPIAPRTRPTTLVSSSHQTAEPMVTPSANRAAVAIDAALPMPPATMPRNETIVAGLAIVSAKHDANAPS